MTVNANLDAGLTAPAENQQVSVSSEDKKTCYVQITFSIDCEDGTEVLRSFFVWGTCTKDFSYRALMAVDAVTTELDLYEC